MDSIATSIDGRAVATCRGVVGAVVDQECSDAIDLSGEVRLRFGDGSRKATVSLCHEDHSVR